LVFSISRFLERDICVAKPSGRGASLSQQSVLGERYHFPIAARRLRN
jgi:hypothetical protein